MKIFPKLFIGFSASFLVVIAFLVGFLQWNFNAMIIVEVQYSLFLHISLMIQDV